MAFQALELFDFVVDKFKELVIGWGFRRMLTE